MGMESPVLAEKEHGFQHRWVGFRSSKHPSIWAQFRQVARHSTLLQQSHCALRARQRKTEMSSWDRELRETLRERTFSTFSSVPADEIVRDFVCVCVCVGGRLQLSSKPQWCHVQKRLLYWHATLQHFWSVGITSVAASSCKYPYIIPATVGASTMPRKKWQRYRIKGLCS